MKTTVLSMFVFATLFTAGCKKEEAKTAEPAATETAKTGDTAAKPAEPAAEAPKAVVPAEPVKADPAAAGVGEVTTEEAYIARGKVFMTKTIETFKTAGTDCEKLATDMDALKNSSEFGAITAYEKAHPESKKKLQEATKAEGDAFMETAMTSMKACKDNEHLKKVMQGF